MIPKIIHYCWFGGGRKPLMIRMCIRSWKKVLPDYELKEWNETNINIKCSPWVEKAYQDRKWAFVADYIRFKILYEEGGLYFDTDILMKKDITPFLNHRFFTQWEFPLDWNYLTEWHIADRNGTFHGVMGLPAHMCMCGMLVVLFAVCRASNTLSAHQSYPCEVDILYCHHDYIAVCN